MFGIGSQELMVILLIAFFIFGAKCLPELGSSLGQAIRGFKKGMEGGRINWSRMRPRIMRVWPKNDLQRSLKFYGKTFMDGPE